MYIVGITPEDYYGETSLAAQNAAKEQLKSIQSQLRPNSEAMAADSRPAPSPGTIKRHPTVQAIATSVLNG